MSDVIYAAGMWLLISPLFGWFFSRGAQRLRETQVLAVGECELAHMRRDADGQPPPKGLSDSNASVLAAVRVFERT
jgi:hypothetical protein